MARFQGPKLIQNRGIQHVSIAAGPKIGAICRSLRQVGHRVIIYSSGPMVERTFRYYAPMTEILFEDTPFDVPVEYGPALNVPRLRVAIDLPYAYRRIRRIIRNYSIDTVFFYNINAFTMLSISIARTLGLKLFCEYEDSIHISRNKKPPKWRKLLTLLEKYVGQHAHGVLAPSPELLDRIGCSNRLWIPGTLDNSLIQAIKHREWSLYGVLEKRKSLSILYAGGLDHSKGIFRFMEAMDQIEFPLDIHICGVGSLAGSLKVMCQRSRHRSTFHGFIDRQRLADLMTSVDVGINPHRSDLHEGGTWPFKVVEYLAACGTVFCNQTGQIHSELQSRLFIYHGNTADEIRKAFLEFLKLWPILQIGAKDRSTWAVKRFGPDGLASLLQDFLDKIN